MHIESIGCMNCGKEIKRGFCRGGDGEHTNIPEQDWEGCDVRITGGYSSDFDLQTFHGVICGGCLLKAIPNLYQVRSVERVRDKTHYFPKGVIGHAEFNMEHSPQDEQRLLDSISSDPKDSATPSPPAGV